MKIDLSGKVALVTGASQGIGAGTAVVLARHGADVAVDYIGPDEDAEEVCERIRVLGRRVYPIKADVTDSEAVKQMAAEVEQNLGPINILVNNAGFNPARNIMDINEKNWDWVLDLNLKAYFCCAKAVLPGMLAQKEGRIINITSISGQRGGFSGDVDYSAAKAGIMGFTRTLARWAAPHGTLVNAIAPGYIDTSMRFKRPQNPDAETRNALIRKVPLQRHGTPEEVGEVVAFLAGPGASYIVGEAISVNGGVHIA